MDKPLKNSTPGKVWGKSHDFGTVSFSKTINSRSFFNCTALEAPGAEVTEVIFKISACFFTFISRNFILQFDEDMLSSSLLFVCQKLVHWLLR